MKAHEVVSARTKPVFKALELWDTGVEIPEW